MSDLRMPVPGAELAYDADGVGPVVVQLHGLSSSREADLALGLDMRTLVERGHRLVRYDARGHGRSTGRPEPDSYRWPDLADDLIALLDGIGATDPVDAIGASMGTATIIHAAVRPADPVARRRTSTLPARDTVDLRRLTRQSPRP